MSTSRTVQAYLTLAAELLPQLIQLGEDVIPTIETMLIVAKQDVPTDPQWDALDAQESALNARINDTSGDVTDTTATTTDVG